MINNVFVKKRYSINFAIKLLKKGKIIILPTETVYGIALSIFHHDKLNDIFCIKQRQKKKKIPVICSNWKQVERMCYFSPKKDIKELGNVYKMFKKRAVTFVFKKKESIKNFFQETIAIRVTTHWWLKKVIERTGPLYVTSCNKSDYCPIKSLKEYLINPFLEIEYFFNNGYLNRPVSVVYDFVNKKILRN